MSIIKSRIKIFLSELEYDKEFTHTILHKYNILNINTSDNKISKKESSRENRKDSNTRNKEVYSKENSPPKLVIHQKQIILEPAQKENLKKVKPNHNHHGSGEKNFYVIEKEKSPKNREGNYIQRDIKNHNIHKNNLENNNIHKDRDKMILEDQKKNLPNPMNNLHIHDLHIHDALKNDQFKENNIINENNSPKFQNRISVKNSSEDKKDVIKNE